jgi:hypothetical protein
MGYNKRYKRLSEFTIAELAGNRCLEEILDFQDLLKQSIHLYLSRFLSNSDEENPVECNILFSFIDSGEKIRTRTIITHIWQDSIEGIIRLRIPNQVIDLDDLVIEDQVYLLECLTQI